MALALLATGCGGDSDTTEAQTSAGEATEETGSTEAPSAEASETASGEGSESTLSFTAQTVSGETFDSAAIEGDVIYWFWAPW